MTVAVADKPHLSRGQNGLSKLSDDFIRNAIEGCRDVGIALLLMRQDEAGLSGCWLDRREEQGRAAPLLLARMAARFVVVLVTEAPDKAADRCVRHIRE